MEVHDSAGHVVEGIRLPSDGRAAAAPPVTEVSAIRKGTLHELLTEAMPTCSNSPQNMDLVHSSSSSNNNNNNNNTDSIHNPTATAAGPPHPKERSLPSVLDPDKPSDMDVSPLSDPDTSEKLTEKVPRPSCATEERKNLTTSINASIVNRFQTSGFQNRPLHGGHQELGKSGSSSLSAFHSVTANISERDASSYRILRDRSNRKPIQERPRQKRQTLQDMTRPLKVWLYHHRDNPYPSKSEKVQLTKSSQMTMTQVSNWFANARRRLKNTVRDPELTWAKRIKLYNNYVEGNQELLSVGSSSSSSSDDDLRDEQDSAQKADSEQRSPSAQCIQEQNGGQDHPTGISNNSALADQGVQQGNNLLDRLSGETHSVAQFHSLSMHEHMNNPCNVEPMDQAPPQVQSTIESQTSSSNSQDLHQPSAAEQQAAEQSHPVHQPVGAISGFGEVESSLDCGETAPKYKTNIMQRYLNDSYQSALNSLGNRDLKESERHRNPSGSLSSHDYEEYMSSASSARSTPTREHQDGHVDEYEEFSRFWPDIKSRAEDDLYWKEISAALALTSLARSRYSTQSH